MANASALLLHPRSMHFRRERAKIFLTSKIDAYQGASCRLGAIAVTRKQLVAAWRYVIRCPGTYRLVD
jgi:hypothetical protein